MVFPVVQRYQESVENRRGCPESVIIGNIFFQKADEQLYIINNKAIIIVAQNYLMKKTPTILPSYTRLRAIDISITHPLLPIVN